MLYMCDRYDCVSTRCIFKAYRSATPDKDEVPVSVKISSEEEDMFFVYSEQVQEEEKNYTEILGTSLFAK